LEIAPFCEAQEMKMEFVSHRAQSVPQHQFIDFTKEIKFPIPNMSNIPTENKAEHFRRYRISRLMFSVDKTDISILSGADFMRSSDKIEKFLHLEPSQ
jgi:hypothetical protein